MSTIPLQEFQAVQAKCEEFRTALESIAGFGSVNLSNEWEGGLRDIIRSMIDCAKTALLDDKGTGT